MSENVQFDLKRLKGKLPLLDFASKCVAVLNPSRPLFFQCFAQVGGHGESPLVY